MSPSDTHSPNDPFDALRRDRDRWAQMAMEQAAYIRQLEEQVNYYKTQLDMKKQEPKQKPNITIENHGSLTLIAEQKNDIHDNNNCPIYLTPNAGKETETNDHVDAPYLPPIPKEGEGYNAVREYIAERRKYDENFRIYWDSHNLKQNCEFLTKEFGWIVDDHSLGTNLNRHR